MDETKDVVEYPANECSLSDEIASVEGGSDEPEMPPVPQHAAEAAEMYYAELDELLAHLAAHPGERWVAYRGRKRLGLSSDHRGLYRECLERFPDKQFCVYGIDGVANHPQGTELLSPTPTEYEEWMSQPTPQLVFEANETFLAELEELLAHRAAHPNDKWVAYHGKQRLGFGCDDLPLYQECLGKFPGRDFCVYFKFSASPDES